ncbi:MAG: vWA domain-containing protein [Dehalococcoidia bacterium]|jgi:Mg-chelatase subunit ChlD
MTKEIKGISIRKESDTGVLVTSDGIKISTTNKPISIHLEQKKGTVFLLLDCSGSMSGYKLNQARQGVLHFARDAIQKNYQVGLIKFDSDAALICNPNIVLSQIENNLPKFEATGSTNMVDAIKMAHDYLKKYQNPLAMVIATDGVPNDALAALKAGNESKKDGIEIITIGTDDADKDFLSRLASRKDLSSVVTKENLAKAIESAALLLPEPRKKS